MRRRFLAFLIFHICFVPITYATWKDDIGFTSLQMRLGEDTPTGAGITVTQIEATDNYNNYMPDVNYAEFTGKTITAKSDPCGASSHATYVGRHYYGTSAGMAPQINMIDVYEVDHWLQNGFIRFQSRYLPLIEDRRIQNHSWIGYTGNDQYDADILRRLDYIVQDSGVLVAVGINNGAGSEMPKLLASAYNVLAVGLTNGDSSCGPTVLDEPGRIKPEIVVPHTTTSWGTPLVASAGALLLETDDADTNLDYLGRTGKVILVKALLMAGATKEEFSDWRKGFSTPSTDGTVPLDYRYGAGELNIDNSHRILTMGEQEAGDSSDVAITGWDFNNASTSGSRKYFIEVPPYCYIDSISILATWNRTFTVTGKAFQIKEFIPDLANIDLKFSRADGFNVGTLVDQSVSGIDNLEHIYLKQLNNGRYVFEIVSDKDWNYAIAWDAQLTPTVKSDFDGDADVDQDDFNHFESCATGPLLGPPSIGCENADLDNDNDVDQSDFALFQRCVSGQDIIAPSACE